MKMEPPPTEYEALLNDNPWREGRIGVVVMALFFGVFGLWAALAPLDAGVVALGEVIVSGNRQVVQHREGGVISRVAVAEGDHVTEGQILLELSAVELAAQERALAGQSIELEASRERLLAEAGRSTQVQRPASWDSLPPEYVTLADAVLARQQDELEARRTAVWAQTGVQGQRQSQMSARIAGYQEQIVAIDRQNALIGEELDGLRTLAQEGFAAETRVRSVERAQSELQGRRAELQGLIEQSREGIGEARMQSVSIRGDRAQLIAQELRVTETQLSDVMPRLQAVRTQLEASRVRAPAAGVVVGLSFFNQGAVIGPGEHILEIVPDEQDMIMRVRIRPIDADNVAVGQPVNVRLSAFEGRQVPYMRAVVDRVSADRFEDERSGAPYFVAEIRAPSSELRRMSEAMDGRDLRLSPGLPVEVVIPLRKRTALQYLLEPLSQAVWRSFREN
ncbi:MAG: HlyD family type I secretion periplasmic adaptor subunit [Caulobacteraceae bacterium]|nr:HlyD family type I secretion periplasmic adaptor subunit [Caulobacteraceae bacterium]